MKLSHCTRNIECSNIVECMDVISNFLKSLWAWLERLAVSPNPKDAFYLSRRRKNQQNLFRNHPQRNFLKRLLRQLLSCKMSPTSSNLLLELNITCLWAYGRRAFSFAARVEAGKRKAQSIVLGKFFIRVLRSFACTRWPLPVSFLGSFACWIQFNSSRARSDLIFHNNLFLKPGSKSNHGKIIFGLQIRKRSYVGPCWNGWRF
jgi:hypothetical protein